MKTRSHVGLGSTLERNLRAYAAVASAAGVGLLAMTPGAEAKVVYTPAYQTVSSNIALDLNHDGVIDFHLVKGLGVSIGNSERISYVEACHQFATFSGHVCFSSTNTPTADNLVKTVPTGAAVLPAGAKIGSGPQWGGKGVPVLLGGRDFFSRTSSFPTQLWVGPWVNGGKGVADRYLGLKFKIGPEFHYGWARLTVTTTGARGDHGFTAVLTGYAYETIPGKAILAGATSDAEEVGVAVPEIGSNVDAGLAPTATLGMLSLGTQGLSAWRRED